MTFAGFLAEYRSYIRVFLILIAWYFIHTRQRRYLSKIPGPLLASFSPIPRLLSVARGSRQNTDIALHRKYGHLVRVAPNVVSVSVSSAIPVIYGASTKFEKSDFYVLFDPKTPHGFRPSVFSVRTEKAHREIKRPIAGAYSMTSLLELEGLTDECISVFQRKVDQKLDASKTGAVEMDLGEWLHWYAFDVIMSITFSKRLGFMEQEKDVGGIIAAIEGRLRYAATVGQMPWLHGLLFGSETMSSVLNMVPAVAMMNTSARIVEFTAQQMKRYGGKEEEEMKYVDMLDRFKKTKDNGEVLMTDTDLLLAASGNVFAGSDTTAISLRAMFYFLMKNPECLKRLVIEVDEMDRKGKLSKFVSFAQSNQMPYLQACLKEAMRMHPAVGLLLERVVPEEGVTIEGQFIPGGTVIGVNPWVVARDQAVYGKDADIFRPERWLDVWKQAEVEGDKGGEAREKVKLMERNFLAFGTGSRTCMGKNISLLEMNKLVPQMLRRYTIELIDPEKELIVEDYWFAKQLGLHCKVSRREG
ncbi:hypothetical protein H2198_004240 [Neophaeococcomyces mojaviensis]|uniref:Uncharacterized protein n=1 Tax=Neophaeococcomyces mojaviensis TaxID=3383035 RepID=A0ACC3A973_9EURO|nr:hypothetical protein H2198_004240 [Knufia sp. JES_112]